MAKLTSAPLNQRIEACLASMVSKLSLSVCCLTTMAFLNPAFSNALFHSSTPSLTDLRYLSGIFLSSQ